MNNVLIINGACWMSTAGQPKISYTLKDAQVNSAQHSAKENVFIQ